MIKAAVARMGRTLYVFMFSSLGSVLLHEAWLDILTISQEERASPPSPCRGACSRAVARPSRQRLDGDGDPICPSRGNRAPNHRHCLLQAAGPCARSVDSGWADVAVRAQRGGMGEELPADAIASCATPRHRPFSYPTQLPDHATQLPCGGHRRGSGRHGLFERVGAPDLREATI